MMTNNGQITTHTDYDLHGIVGIRLLDANPVDVATVSRQLGPIKSTLTRDPDIIIRFVDKLSRSSPIRYLNKDDAGFTDDAFLVMRSKHKAKAMVQIPFEQIGHQCTIICERGLPAVTLLLPIMNLTALNKGVLPLHASAFIYNGNGVLVTGWAKGGKTETLLAFMANGAEYVGDEWIYISNDGQHMYGLPEPIRLWNWHLQDMPEYQALVGPGDRARLRVLDLFVRSLDKAASRSVGRGSAPVKFIYRLSTLLKRQLNVQIPPKDLFHMAIGPLMAPVDKVFFVGSHETPDIALRPIDPEDVALRMVNSLQEEQIDILSYYWKFRFAFPGVRNELIEQVEERQYALLLRFLTGKEISAVYHPYPVSIPALFETISPLLQEAS